MSQAIDATAIDWNSKLQARPDLRVKPADTSRDCRSFNLLDPITRQCYRIGALEQTVIDLMNGRRSLIQVFEKTKLNPQFRDFHPDQFLCVVEHFQRSGLVTGSGTLSPLVTHPPLRFSLNNLVSWQLRGLQPDRFLVWLAPHTNGLFSAVAVRFWLLLSVFTLGLVLLEFPRLINQTALWSWVIRPLNGSLLFAVFLSTRALHELGHALVCRRHGVRCPDIGLFVILGAPCVYCDVSESAHLPNRWHRAAVAAAGMYVELIIATLAAWIWLLTLDGPINTLALQSMIVCSISTVLINANPLMRFDGYYIVSDVLNEPNLRNRADALAHKQLLRWVLGRTAASQSGSWSWIPCGLVVFSWAGWFYRAGLAMAIAFALYSIYDYWQMTWLGRILALSILLSWWGVPILTSAVELQSIASRMGSQWRLGIFTALVATCFAVLPMPYREMASGWTQPSQMHGIYALHGGRLIEQLTTNESDVLENQPIMRLSDLDAERELKRLESIEKRSRVQLIAHQRNRLYQATQAIDLAPIESTVEMAKQQVANAQNEVARLTLASPASGRLVMMPVASHSGPGTLASDMRCSNWGDPIHLGRYIHQGTMVAAVCSSNSVAVLPITDEQLEWIAEGTEVRLRCGCDATQVHFSRVSAVVPLREAMASMRLIESRKESRLVSDDDPQDNAYAAVVELPENFQSPLNGTVDAVFLAPSQTILSLSKRWLRQNLRWLAD
jgi:putative peptide zinc metalloprotease protein